MRSIMPSSVPEAMIIAEFDPCTRSLNKIKNGYNSTEIINAWIYKGGILDRISMTKEPKLSTDFAFYKETYARFAYSEEKRVLYLDIDYAPRYARGWMYSLIDSDDGLILGDRKLIWIS